MPSANSKTATSSKKKPAPKAAKPAVKTGTSARAASPKRKPKRDPAELSRHGAKDALDQATKAIAHWQKDAARNTWAIGRRLAQVAELKIYRGGGFPTLEAYVEDKLKISRQTAYQYIRVAEAFSEEVTATFGAEKLDRALRYIAATPEDEKPSDVPELRIAVAGTDGAPTRTKPFTEVTVSELRMATQAVAGGAAKAHASKKDKLLPEGLAGKLAKANRALDKAVGSKAAKAAEIRARLVGAEVTIEVRGVPLDRAAAALRAIAGAL